MFFQLLLTY